MASATSTAGRARTSPKRGGRGRVLAAALEQVEQFPALDTARDRLLDLVGRGAPSSDLAETVESDVGLAIAVLHAASLGPGKEQFSSTLEAVELLGPAHLEAAARGARTYQLLDHGKAAAVDAERFRLHSLTVQRAADAIAETTGSGNRDAIALAALLHDSGRLVLARLHAGYAERFDRRLGSPEERIAEERRELGIDHALVGGVLARRWQLSNEIAAAIERHHSDEDHGIGTIVRLADMLAAHTDGFPLNEEALRKVAATAGIEDDALREVIYELPRGAKRRRRASAPCPLSARELEVLRGLSEGKVYKQIAYELDLSASTVRSHLHNVYGKLGALDRAQAVLMATEHGWL